MFPIINTVSKTSIADWAEWYVAHSQESLSKSALSSAIASAKGADPTDNFVDSIWLELGQRQALYGDNSPIKVLPRLLESRFPWAENPSYMACLIFSVTGNIEGSGYAGQLFEEVSNIAVKRYINGESITCGFPMKLKAKELSRLVKEDFVKDYPKFRQDRNLDVMVWRPFGDNRPSQLIILVQCAAGKNWRDKTKELNIKAWQSYINFLSPPLKSFTLPDIISDAERFEDYSHDSGIIFDRSRIYRCINGIDLEEPLKKRLIKWCKIRITKMNKTAA